MARDKTTTFSIRLTGDAGPAVAALRKLSAQLASTEGDFRKTADAINSEAARIEKGLERSSGGGRGGPAAGGSRLQSAASDRVSNLADTAGLGEFSDEIAGAVGKLGGLGVAMAAVTVGAAALGKALFEVGQFSLSSMTELSSEVGKLSAVIGVSVEDADRFRHAFSLKGVDTTQMIDALVQMQTNLQAAPEKFEALGIAQARFADGSADLVGTFDNLRAAWQAGDAGMKSQIGSIGLGEEAYKELIPWLMATKEETDAMQASLRNAMTPEDIARSKQYDEAMAALSESMKKAGQTIGVELAPYMVVLANGLASVAANAGKVVDVLGAAGGAGFEVLKAGLESIPGAGFIGMAVGEMGDRWVGAAGDVKSSASVMGAAMSGLSSGAVILEGAMKATADEAKRVAGLRNDLVSSYQGISDAKLTVQEAARNTASVEADAAASISSANEQAEASIASAAQGMASAHKGQADAAAGLAQAEAQAARTMSDAARAAEKSIAGAQKRVVDAQEKRVDADEELLKVERDVSRTLAKLAEDTADRIVDAQQRVTDAREDARRAERDGARDLADARTAYQDALLGSLDEDNPFKAQRDREKALLDLQRTETDVAESNQDAARKVSEAEADLRDVHVEAAENRAEAEERATEQIADARERQAESITALRDAEVGLSETIQEAEQSKADAAASAASSVTAARQRVVDADAAAYQAAVVYGRAIEDADRAKAKAAEDAATRVEAARKRESDAAMKLLLDELAIARIRRRIANPNFVDRMSMSESNYVAESDTVPRFHGGGTYHAPTPGGEGLAILRDGETVLTPGQSAGGTTIVVQGSVISERDLVEIIAKAQRRGYSTGRN